jgi:hypothetical protein
MKILAAFCLISGPMLIIAFAPSDVLLPILVGLLLVNLGHVLLPTEAS